jgi:hypothetical protein
LKSGASAAAKLHADAAPPRPVVGAQQLVVEVQQSGTPLTPHPLTPQDVAPTMGRSVDGAIAAEARGAATAAAAAPSTRLFKLTDAAINLGERGGFLLENPENPEKPLPSAEKPPQYGLAHVVRALSDARVSGGEESETRDARRWCTPPIRPRVLPHTCCAASARHMRSDHRPTAQLSASPPRIRHSARVLYRAVLWCVVPGCIVGCNAVALTAGGRAWNHLDKHFECLVSPVARDLSLGLHASPFFTAAKSCDDWSGPPLLEADGERVFSLHLRIASRRR